MLPVLVPGLGPIDFECSFAHLFLCFPKFHWRQIETHRQRQILVDMVGKVSESKENAKIRSFNFNNGSTCKVFNVLTN